MIRAAIGSVSNGTLRDLDLVQCFMGELHTLAKSTGNADDIQLYESFSHDISELIEALEAALQEYAPPLCYFGAHPGDCCDFGFWPNYEAIEMGIRDGEILQVCDLSQVPADSTYEYVWLVNDHGNGSLFSLQDAELREEWSVV